MAWKSFTLNGEKMHVPLGSKLPKSCALTTESQSPSCAKAGQSGYFLFISIFTLQPSVSLACFFCCCFLVCCVWCFFLASRKIELILGSFASFQSNSYLPKGPVSQTEVLTLALSSCSELQALPWPGSLGSEGGNALACIPAGSLLIQPTGHLVFSPCYAHSLV